MTTTLSELERKLKELERELESVGRGGELDAEPAQAGWTPPPDPSAGPPPPGATPLTAVWHGGATPPSGPPPVADEPVRVVPPPAPRIVAQPHAAASPPPPPPPPPASAAEPGGLHEQLDELIAFRDRLVRTTDELVGELSRVLDELGVVAPPPPPPDPALTPLSGDVVVEAAAFDLATLASLEQALRAVGGAAHAHVRALDDGVAYLDVRLSAPLPLGAALRAAWPVPFAVTGAGDGRLAIAPA
ncbi:MAG TPA: hypothetical protein VFG42_21625 [Baekduia sp.]|nr:hypothetical protein [Baekduia sp.]